MKYYVVRVGRNPGIYTNWKECESQVKGFSGADYKSFKTKIEAEEYLKREKKLISNSSGKTTIYTDGSCIDQIGGYGFIYIDEDILPICGRVPIDPCTNQKAELYAIYKAIQFTNSSKIHIYTDSMYSINCLTEWYKKWELNGWKTSGGKDVENQGLIKDILRLKQYKDIRFFHVKAHNGDEYNEWADRLANMGRSE